MSLSPLPFLFLLLPLSAYAALGGQPMSLPLPQSTSTGTTGTMGSAAPVPSGAAGASPQARSSLGPATSFTVQTSTLPSGTLVREYIDGNGTVFAVSWEGPGMPDLRSLFGDTYFTQYVHAAAIRRAGHGSLFVSQPTLVVQSSGRMRAFFGKAYVPQLMPRGVSIDQIQ